MSVEYVKYSIMYNRLTLRDRSLVLRSSLIVNKRRTYWAAISANLFPHYATFYEEKLYHTSVLWKSLSLIKLSTKLLRNCHEVDIIFMYKIFVSLESEINWNQIIYHYLHPKNN